MDEGQMVSCSSIRCSNWRRCPTRLVNEINLYADQLPSQEPRWMESPAAGVGCAPSPWSPVSEVYGAWNTTNPNAYGPDLAVLGREHVAAGAACAMLTARNCGFRMPVPPVLTSRFRLARWTQPQWRGPGP
jgi:hypothetical protein